jgi:hypothetical protein
MPASPSPSSSRAPRRPRRAALLALVPALALLSSPAAAAPTAPVAVPPLRGAMTTLMTQLSQRSGPSDAQYWSAGVFRAENEACTPCHLGPATAAAIMRASDPEAPAWLDPLAIESFDRSLGALGADGLFVDPTNASAPIATMFFANELGTALVKLGTRLPAATRDRWRAALQRAADRIIARRELTWYANGNIQLGYAEMMYLTWVATGATRYRDAFETAWRYATSPPLSATGQTGGAHGLIVTRAPKAASGADGAGYFSETGVGGSGYDPYYTVLQNDVLARLYLLSRDARVLRALNLVTNQQLARVNATTMQIDLRGGTRVPTAGDMPFTTAGPMVLAAVGGRADLADTVARQVAVAGTREIAQIGVRADPIQYRDVGTKLATGYEALLEASGRSTLRKVALRASTSRRLLQRRAAAARRAKARRNAASRSPRRASTRR